MRKYDLISALSAETSREVARNEESWKKYLNTASRLYKYPFKDQLLIYAQKPDAAACASIEIWNEKMHCWVNKGAKGIALIDEEGSPYTGLRYVFDISDVHKARRIGRFPQLWEMREEHQEAVLDCLEGIYGDTNKEAGFTDRIREIAARIAQDCYGKLASDMEYLKEGSFLEELDGLNIAVRVRETLADSIAYTVLKRCGMEDAELAEEIQFPYIHEFNTVKTLSHIGDSISDLSMPVLMEIGKAIGAYDKEYARNEASKNFVEKGLANTSDTRYNALKREREAEDVQFTTPTGNAGERGKYDESELREERGLHDTDAADGRTARGNTDEIRTDEEKLFTGTQKGNLHRTSAEWEAERASFVHSGTGRAEDGDSDSADGRSGGRDGGTESSRSDEMGGDDEQHQALGGGNRAERAGIQSVNEEITENKELAEPDSGESLSGLSFSSLEKKDPETVAETKDTAEKDDFSDIDTQAVREHLEKAGIVDGQLVDENALENDPFIRQVMGDVEALTGETGAEPEKSPEKVLEKEPEIDKSGASNYHISFNEAENTGKGFALKEKFRQNVEAIRTLEKIEGERRTATPEEQEVLAKYVGWGGLADAFDSSKANWANEYRELKSLLSPEEYASARESTLNAHYTSPVIIQAVYDAVGKMGFTRGNVLDPAAGIGNFYGCLPEEMQGSRLYGAELDGITGRIAKQLYPHADIQITGFENTSYPNDFFDVAVGNVPFGQYKVSDRQYDKHNFLIHDYFFGATRS